MIGGLGRLFICHVQMRMYEAAASPHLAWSNQCLEIWLLFCVHDLELKNNDYGSNDAGSRKDA